MKKPKQTEMSLPGESAIRTRQPGPAEPLFWFTDFRILSRFSPDPKDLVRKIEFHEGLNIVWSHEPAETSSDAKSRTAGHAGGKTSLCRLLSGLLGEKVFMDAALLSSIQEAYPDGWFAGIVRVNGSPWCVARSFDGDESLAEQMESLDEFLRTDRHDQWTRYQAALLDAAGQISSIAELPGGALIQPWSFFPWFIRDQESQFASVGDWVDASSGGTGSPALSETNKSLVVRSVFDEGIVDEVRLLDEQKKIAEQLSASGQNRHFLQQRIEAAEKHLFELYGNENFQGDQGDLWIREQIESCEKQIKELVQPPADDSPFAQAQVEFDMAQAIHNRRAEDCAAGQRQQKRFYDLHREYLRALPNPLPEPVCDDDLERIVRSLPERKFCCVSMKLARAEHCKLALGFEDGARGGAVQAKEPDIASEYGQISMVAQEAETEYEEAKAKLAAAKRKLEEEKSKREATLVEQSAELGAKRDNLIQLRSCRTSADDAETVHKDLTDKKKEVADKIKAVRIQSEGKMAALREYFRETVQFVYGDEAKGIVGLNDGIIQLDAKINETNRRGAALKAANVVCFDLALLALSTAGLCRHPRFLVHDGPRVADVSNVIYARYFEFAALLADRPGKPNFQYIVTTTTNPPERFRGKEFVVCELDASTADGRLFKKDLT